MTGQSACLQTSVVIDRSCNDRTLRFCFSLYVISSEDKSTNINWFVTSWRINKKEVFCHRGLEKMALFSKFMWAVTTSLESYKIKLQCRNSRTQSATDLSNMSKTTFQLTGRNILGHNIVNEVMRFVEMHLCPLSIIQFSFITWTKSEIKIALLLFILMHNIHFRGLNGGGGVSRNHCGIAETLEEMLRMNTKTPMFCWTDWSGLNSRIVIPETESEYDTEIDGDNDSSVKMNHYRH